MIPSGVGNQRPFFGMVGNLPVTASSILHQTQQMNVIKHEPMDVSPAVSTLVTADLYLCDSGNANSRERPSTVESNASVDVLEKEHRRLVQTKIKDSLSSFVPDIPGEFDSSANPESMLRTLIDRPPIGGREFLPLSDQSLLGFRLHPGPLPEQYRLDPLTLTEPHKHHKKKKKHKHKHVDKVEETSLTNYSPSISREHSPPGDPCDFIKRENMPNFFPPPAHPSRPSIHNPPQSSQLPPSSAQPHLIQANPISSHSATLLQTGSAMATTGLFNLVSPTMASPHQSVIVQAPSYQHVPGYSIPTGTGPGAANILSSLKIPAKPKKKHRNPEGVDGMQLPKKKKKNKDKDKEKSKEKRKRKHHNPDGMVPTSSLAGIVPVPSSAMVTPPLALTLSSPAAPFTNIHSTSQQ